jgi:hypothetical protein
MLKTPAGFGELIYDDGTNNPLNGMMVREIASDADSMISARTYTAALQSNAYYESTCGYVNLDSTIRRINRAFEGRIDTLEFAANLCLKGTKKLVDVPYLKPNPGVEPTIMRPALAILEEEPASYALYQNYPNPFNPTTTISFNLTVASIVTLKAYDILGQEVATLVDHELMDEGEEDVEFDAGMLASGVYFYRLVAEPTGEDGNLQQKFVSIRKMIVVK